MIDKNDIAYKPNREEMAELLSCEKREMFDELCGIAEKEYGGKSQIDFSKCSGAYGWNIKYKKSGKSVIVLYPESDKITALVTLRLSELEVFDIIKAEFSKRIQQLIEKTSVFNNTKWVFTEITDKEIFNDYIKLLKLKFKNN